MKTNFIFQTFVMLFFVFAVSAQQGINYKAIINDANGDVIVNTAVTVQFTILEDGTTEVYKETHNPTTDANGIVIVNIGEGTVLSGVFNDINWGGNPHFLKTEINTGSGLTDMGTTEFKAVPYALHSKTAGNAINTAGLNPGDLLMFDGDAFVPATFSFYYQDNDLDEYGNESVFVYSPVKPDGFVLIGRDCDDSNENVNPEIEEICDGIDNNCDGEIDEGCDLDQDGYSVNEGDCDDDNPDVNPGEIEICSDGIDNDCDGEIDEGCDLDQDGYSVNEGDCDDYNPNINPGAQEICDDVDNDCDGQTDEGLEFVYYYQDKDGDGYGSQNTERLSCRQPWESYSLIFGDCDDEDASIYPEAIELCDGKDNDCDGQIDEDCGIDTDGDGYTISDGDCDDNDATVNPSATEICDGKDNDCNGDIDEVCQADVHVELTWDTPADPDQMDYNGTDMDIHLKITQEEWMSTWDCYFANPNPNWGVFVSGDDDPILERDDSDGTGPEIINFSFLENIQYTLGVHYVNDNGFGSSFSTVKIFVHGILQFQKDNIRMEEGDFLEVAIIDNNSGSIIITESIDAEGDGDGDGFTVTEGDCDDADFTVNPGATEICGDGIDQDCDGNDLLCNTGTQATGSITTVSKIDIIDGEDVIISDGETTVVFEFDTQDDGCSSDNHCINISTSITAEEVAIALINGINSEGSSLQVTALSEENVDTITLINDNIGSTGNVAIINNVANPGFITTGMSGGVNP